MWKLQKQEAPLKYPSKMAFNFWQAQKRARSWTLVYLVLFVAITAAVAFFIEWAMRELAADAYHPDVPLLALFYLGITFLVAGGQYMVYKQFGGSYVAQSVGAVQVKPGSGDLRAQQLLNIVDEIAIASSLPSPPVYILRTPQINAFAAGLTKDNAAITITEGALKLLNRDEVQGVIAHEFGHIYNGDMKISMRLAAMVLGFFWVMYLGARLLQNTRYIQTGDDDRRGGNPIALMALLLVCAGTFTWFAGSILKACVSRQREYLADACAVQFTRNPEGISNALRKIATADQPNEMPQAGSAYSHMYFDDRGALSSIFATHPPIWKRIAAIEGRDYLPEEWKKDLPKM